ncbi:DUF3373 family protein [Desulfospira joergensenii]|uniref:DUF3373 family protein n=1 Tax=Desulfospira joergensenii TaxID=53329 RepID=UPI0003B349F4|nr:DUF3373 family protein [Desulfospira joergensenii]
MKKDRKDFKRLFILMVGSLFLWGMISPGALWADAEVDALKEQLRQLTEMVQTVQKKLADMEEARAEKDEEIKEMDDRLNQAELHTATDKLTLGVELRSRGDSIHYGDLLTAPDSMMNGFFTDYNAGNPALGGFNNATAAQIQALIAMMAQNNMVPDPEENDIDNDIIYTNRFRINMKAKLNNQLAFAGRIAAYKVWGDSAEVQFNQGSMSDIGLDGTTSSLPSGDGLNLERAYFNYRNSIGEIPYNFSLGRRPSTEGPPLEYSQYSLVGGSPLAHIINWQFDGASLSFGLEEMTGIPGAAFKLCYGVGFEGGWGNSSSFNNNSQVDDVHMFGFIADLYDDDITSAVLNFAYAVDVTDGFTGQTVMPFTISVDNDPLSATYGNYTFERNSGAFVSRLEPVTNLGDWSAATFLVKHNFMEQFDKDIDVFFSLAWSHTDPDRVSSHPFYGLLGQGLLSSNGDLQSRDGYSIYTGAVFPMPFDARLGIEYNWGSKYWFNFTGAEDSLVDSKLAARGQVWEAYYIQPVFDDNFFVTLGGRYYDYKYTGSGNPLGAPVEISDASAMDTLFPVVDKVWNLYLSVNFRM